MKYLIALILITLTIPTDLHAQAQPMQTFVEDFPFWDGSGTGSYIEALYKIAISMAAVLVVLRLIWAGVKYMFSEVVTNKQEAKEDIKSALLGLLIILGAVTILTTINPQLTNLDVVGTGPSVQLSGDAQSFRYDLQVGDSWTHSSVLGHCGSTSNEAACYQDRVDYLADSCSANNGVLKQEWRNVGTAGSCAASALRYGGLGAIDGYFNLGLIPECGRSWVCTESQ